VAYISDLVTQLALLFLANFKPNKTLCPVTFFSKKNRYYCNLKSFLLDLKCRICWWKGNNSVKCLVYIGKEFAIPTKS
jgi:hypothetical protein